MRDELFEAIENGELPQQVLVMTIGKLIDQVNLLEERVAMSEQLLATLGEIEAKRMASAHMKATGMSKEEYAQKCKDEAEVSFPKGKDTGYNEFIDELFGTKKEKE